MLYIVLLDVETATVFDPIVVRNQSSIVSGVGR